MSSPSAAPSTLSPASPRLKSIDIFRGATIAAMILVNGQFSHEESYRQLAHAAWNGWTFADTIFPCFLFIVGVSLTLSTASRVARGEDRSRLLGHALRRSLLIFACGVVIDYLRVPIREFPFVGLQAHLQLTGVSAEDRRLLSRGLPHLPVDRAAWRDRRDHRPQSAVSWPPLLLPGARVRPRLTGRKLQLPRLPRRDRARRLQVEQHGLRSRRTGSHPPRHHLGPVRRAGGTVLLSERRPRQRLLLLLGGGIVLIAAGELLSTWVPINKQLWTTSFAVFMAGLAATGLACSIWLVDGRPLRRWFRPLEILGLNAIAAYLISRLVANVPRVHVMGKSLYTDVLARVASPPNASLLFAMVVLAAVYLAVWLMDRRGWYLKF